ncbi:hypothetical protein I3843_15G116000 [Carya illinoinensis]|uniref:Uncharacterized protein n=1 Tax=Carya illinoinensis TaxID=32201 RepID=A0A8T1N752_CARIL|nr:hypothetical protein CIPAW_15G136800 [Carya illinoinensis]KAG7944692.1 hypothetical protein I3843_15G116000 [Carya illinoinensis]
MGLNSFFHFITIFILIAAAILAMHPYQISADMNARKLGRAKPSPPPAPAANKGRVPNPPPSFSTHAGKSGKT